MRRVCGAVRAYLALAEGHLAAGWAYNERTAGALCAGAPGVRVADIDRAKTLAKLRTGNVLDPQQRIKISRPAVKGLIFAVGALLSVAAGVARLFSVPGT